MKIGFDARGAIWYQGTGIGTYSYQLAKSLYMLDKRNEYCFFCPGDEFEDFYPSIDEVFKNNAINKEEFWEEVQIPARVAHEKFDIYHVPQNGIGLPKTKGYQKVATVHDLIPYSYPEASGVEYLNIFKKEMPRIMEQCDMILTVSEFSKRDIQLYFNVPDEKITIIYEAAEDIYRRIEKNKAKKFIKQQYGITSRYLLYVGGLSHRKNVMGLILAFSNILKDIPEDYKLVIVGKQDRSYKDLRKQIETLKMEDRVIFTGFVPVSHLPYLYNAAELFVYPSLYEGFGLPPLEAMACGTPVIASNVTSIPEVTGEAAVLINPHDHYSLAASIEKTLSKPDQLIQMSNDGIKQAKKFSWNKCAQETLDVYESLYKLKD